MLGLNNNSYKEGNTIMANFTQLLEKFNSGAFLTNQELSQLQRNSKEVEIALMGKGIVVLPLLSLVRNIKTKTDEVLRARIPKT